MSQCKITVLRNGVDLDKFSPPVSTTGARATAGELSILSVGHLVEEKGHHLAIEALTDIADTNLTIIGEGPSH